jgi:Na+/H+ antiporter NhaD/arsenite permease-like protein
MSLDALLAVATFVAVLLATAAGVTHLTAAALLGAVLLLATGVLTMPEAVQSVALSQGTLTLLFGMMVLVRALEATGVFAVVAHRLLPLSRGKGSRLLIGVVMLTTVICAWLPNATTVLLIGPLLPPLAREVKLDPRPLLILLVLTANSAGLLTLIGDPATYIVGTGLGLSFWACWCCSPPCPGCIQPSGRPVSPCPNRCRHGCTIAAPWGCCSPWWP